MKDLVKQILQNEPDETMVTPELLVDMMHHNKTQMKSITIADARKIFQMVSKWPMISHKNNTPTGTENVKNIKNFSFEIPSKISQKKRRTYYTPMPCGIVKNKEPSTDE